MHKIYFGQLQITCNNNHLPGPVIRELVPSSHQRSEFSDLGETSHFEVSIFLINTFRFLLPRYVTYALNILEVIYVALILNNSWFKKSPTRSPYFTNFIQLFHLN